MSHFQLPEGFWHLRNLLPHEDSSNESEAQQSARLDEPLPMFDQVLILER